MATKSVTYRVAKVVSVKPSEYRPNTFYVTLDDGQGTLKAVTTLSLSEGMPVRVKIKQGAFTDQLVTEIIGIED